MTDRIDTLAQEIESRVQAGDTTSALEALAAAHPAEQAQVFLLLPPNLRTALQALLSSEQMARLLAHLDEKSRAAVVDEMPRAALARVLDNMDNDVAADVLHRLPPAEAARVLSLMVRAPEVTPLLIHADTTAGGLMTRGFVAIHPEMTASDAINYLRLRKPDAEEAYYLYVLDQSNRLEGVLSLRHLIVADPNTPVKEIMDRQVLTVGPDTDQEECARLIQRYRLRALPVVDAEGRLLGVTTMDDLMYVAQEEATEDMYHMAGMPGGEKALSPIPQAIQRRLPWLAINLVTAFLAAFVVSRFESTISQATALAVFMPVIAGQGGNAGIQTITIIVRGLALGEVDLKDARRVLLKEVIVSIMNGLAIGLVVGVLAWAWRGNATLGLVVFLAMTGNLAVAGLFGVLVPMTLRFLRLDPALASGVLLTTSTDVMGFLFLLGLASLLISRLA